MTADATRPADTETPVLRVRVRRLPSRMEQLVRELHDLYWCEPEHGYWPSLIKLMGPLGYKSTATVRDWLKKAVNAGYLLELDAPGHSYGHRQYRPNYERLVLLTEGGVMTAWERIDG